MKLNFYIIVLEIRAGHNSNEMSFSINDLIASQNPLYQIIGRIGHFRKVNYNYSANS
jgi:hypothetical protein